MNDNPFTRKKRFADQIRKLVEEGAKNLVYGENDEEIALLVASAVRSVIAKNISVEIKESTDKGEVIVVLKGPPGLLPLGRVVHETGIQGPTYAVMKAHRHSCYRDEGDPHEEITVHAHAKWGEHDDGEDAVFKLTSGKGITGHESFNLTRFNVTRVCEVGWSACAGTPGRYDAIFIPADEMRGALNALGILDRLGLGRQT